MASTKIKIKKPPATNKKSEELLKTNNTLAKKRIFPTQWKIIRVVLLEKEISRAMTQAHTDLFVSYAWKAGNAGFGKKGKQPILLLKSQTLTRYSKLLNST